MVDFVNVGYTVDMSNIVSLTFNLPVAEVRSFFDDDGNPWFVAKDVCQCLDLDNVSMACKRLDEADVRITQIDTDGMDTSVKRDMLIINEPGLYELVIRSDKPAARAFTHWVTHEVLPALRRTGSYSLPGRELNRARKPTRWGWQPILDEVRRAGYTMAEFVRAANALDLSDVGHFTDGNYGTYGYGKALPTDAFLTRTEALLGVPRERLFTAEVLAAYPSRGPGRRH